jgi:dihydrofolate reductase
MLSGIVAMTRDQKIMGKNNSLPWHLPGDLKFFKATTLGQRIVMGRKTFESIGSKALPKRENWVLTKQGNIEAQEVSLFHSKDEILKQLKRSGGDKKTFIIGGSKVFEIFWPDMEEIFVTWIEQSFEGDIQFPDLKWDGFHCLSERREIEPFPHSFCHYVRKS